MRFGINLRGDFTKLDDGEIASRFESLMAKREAMFQSMPSYFGNKSAYQKGAGLPFGRGLFHARIFYKLNGLSAYFGSRLYDLYLVDCEIKDIRDEIQHRVTIRKSARVKP